MKYNHEARQNIRNHIILKVVYCRFKIFDVYAADMADL